MGLSLKLQATVGTSYKEAIRSANEVCIKLNLDFVNITGNDTVFTVYQDCDVDFIDAIAEEQYTDMEDFNIQGLRIRKIT